MSHPEVIFGVIFLSRVAVRGHSKQFECLDCFREKQIHSMSLWTCRKVPPCSIVSKISSRRLDSHNLPVEGPARGEAGNGRIRLVIGYPKCITDIIVDRVITIEVIIRTTEGAPTQYNGGRVSRRSDWRRQLGKLG
jgi:hypothetical protein